jgi:hypothetical protein
LLQKYEKLARRINITIVQASFNASRNAGPTQTKNDELISKKRRKVTKNKANNKLLRT